MQKILKILFICIFFYLPAFVVHADANDSTNSSALITPPDASLMQPQQVVTQRANYNNSPANYSSLPTCPNDPNNGSPVQPTCPDVNGNLPANAPGNCYDVCKASRRDVTNFDSSHTVTNATCPINYSQIDSYNTQPQYVFNPSPPSQNAPLSWSNYTTYNANGYTCTLGNSQYWNNCGRNSGNFLPNHATYVPTMVTEVSGSPAGMYYWSYADQTCWFMGSNCSSKSAYQLSDKLCTNGAYDSNVWLQYALYSCKPPPGLYASGYNIETSIICARNISSWTTIN